MHGNTRSFAHPSAQLLSAGQDISSPLLVAAGRENRCFYGLDAKPASDGNPGNRNNHRTVVRAEARGCRGSNNLIVRTIRSHLVTNSMLSTTAVLRLVVLFVFHNPIAAADTLISFPHFAPPDDFFTLRDVAYHPDHRSYVINAGARTLASRGSCGVLAYGKNVRIQNVATGRVASFSSSFTFTFTTHGVPWDNMNNTLDGSGIRFAIVPNLPLATLHTIYSKMDMKFGACKILLNQNIRVRPPIFSVEIDTDYNPSREEEPSNNFIRVARNLENENDVQAYTHNLCGNVTHCSYFSNGRLYTAWIDFTSSTQTLEFRLAEGSLPKPVQPLLLISNYKFPKGIGDEVMLVFLGSSDVNHLEEHELLSWTFFSTEISESRRIQALFQSWKSRTWVGVTAGVLFGTLAASVILWFVFSLTSPSSSYAALGYSTGPRVFSYDELCKATDNFDERNVLGRGGTGVVYKGALQDGHCRNVTIWGVRTLLSIFDPGGGVLVAVKQINMSESMQARSLFHAEVASLGQIRHRNVVQLQGWCQDKGKLLLVYEYLSNGTLHDWLYKNGTLQVLSLEMRLSILEGVGVALKYLHEDGLNCIIHRDIKPTNVLLDANFNAYIGDFGLARLMGHHQLDKTTLAAGTFGYIAPELPYTGKATKESDVYSFGILVLEVVCGRHPLDLQGVEPEDLVLLCAVWRAYEGGSLSSMADARMLATSQPSREVHHQNCNITPKFTLVGNVDFKTERAKIVSLLQLGLFCCLPNPKARPCMGEVNRLLHEIRDISSDSNPIATILMPSLPSTKPLGLYHSLEFSCSFDASTSTTPSPTSMV